MCILALCVYDRVVFPRQVWNPPTFSSERSGSVSAEWWMMSSSVANPLKLWLECRGLKNKITFNGHSLLCRIKYALDTSGQRAVSLKPLWMSHILNSCGKTQSINDSHLQSQHTPLWAIVYLFFAHFMFSEQLIMSTNTRFIGKDRDLKLCFQTD